MDSKEIYIKIKRKIRNKVRKLSIEKSYFLADQTLLKNYEEQYASSVSRNRKFSVETDIEQKSLRAMRCHARDYAFERILKKEAYTFRYPFVAPDPYGLAPLTALVLFQTEEPYQVRFTAAGREGSKAVTAVTGLSRFHRVPVYGMLPGYKNEILLELLDKEGITVKSRKLKIYTEPLPEKLETVLQEKKFGQTSAFPMIFITGGSLYPMAFDQNCEVRYYLKVKTSSYGVFPLKNGRLLWGEPYICAPTFANAHTCQIHEIDYMGRIHRTMLIEKGLHHFATELPNGNIVSISNTLDGCTEDALVEIDRRTGKVVQTIDMRIFFGEKYRDMTDWVHPNSLSYDAKEDTMLVCFRNVHTVLKFRWTDKEMIWVLSIPEFWEGLPVREKVLSPKGEITWNYQAHAALEMPRKEGQAQEIRRIMVFDNHRINRRPCDQFNESDYSYINVYMVNEKEHTVEMEKQFEIPKSLIRSNAVYDSKTNRVFAMEGCLAKTEQYRGRILEMDYETGKVLNSVCLEKDFFSAHKFSVGYEGLTGGIAYAGEYLADDLDGLKRSERLAGELPKLKEEVITDILLREEILYFEAVDHTVEKLYFQGECGTYVKDYTNTRQTAKVHEGKTYYCVVSLRDLPTDRYTLAVQYQGQVYGWDKILTIKNEESTGK